MTEEEYQKWLSEFGEAMVEDNEVEAKTTELGNGMKLTVYQPKESDVKMAFKDNKITTYREIVKEDGSITLYQFRDNGGQFVSTREFREVNIGLGQIKTGEWSISELKLN